MLLVFLPSARADIKSAVEWYEKKQFGLGKKFRQEVVKTVDSVLDPRRGYGTVYMNLSRVFVKKFPYVIYFNFDAVRERMVVFAVLHEKQNRDEILRERSKGI